MLIVFIVRNELHKSSSNTGREIELKMPLIVLGKLSIISVSLQ